MQFEEVAEEKAASNIFESEQLASSSNTSLPESLAKLSDVIICPEASESEKDYVSFQFCDLIFASYFCFQL